MLIDIILKFIYTCIAGIIDLIPSMDFTLPTTSFEIVYKIFATIGYFVPIAALMPILVFIVAKNTFKIAYAIWLVIKSYIPSISGS